MLVTNLLVKPDTRVVVVTPEKAAAWLKQNKKTNRKISKDRIERYARDMRAGKWDLNAETIKFNTVGELLDGQHRLHACVIAGVSFTTLVCRGLPDDAMKNVDIGKNRTFSDRLSMRGAKGYLASKTAIARALLNYERKLEQPTNEELDEFYETHQEEVDAAALFTSKLRSDNKATSRGISGTAAGLFYLLACRKNHKPKATYYLEQLYSGENINKQDAAYAIRRKLFEGKNGSQVTMPLQFIAFIKGWEFVKRNEPVGKLFLLGRNSEEVSIIEKWRESKI